MLISGVSTSEQYRFVSLDSLRGIASLVVLLGHIISVCDWNAGFTEILFLNNLHSHPTGRHSFEG
jgi:peptidoglycan/LPS O-acetylase OafA/YrhL